MTADDYIDSSFYFNLDFLYGYIISNSIIPAFCLFNCFAGIIIFLVVCLLVTGMIGKLGQKTPTYQPMSKFVSHPPIFNRENIQPLTEHLVGSNMHIVNEHVYRTPEHMLVLHVHGPHGMMFPIKVDPAQSCNSIHQLVTNCLSCQLEHDASDMYTVCSTKLLENNHASFNDIGVKQMAIISVNLRLCGGICVPFSRNQKRSYGNVSTQLQIQHVCTQLLFLYLNDSHPHNCIFFRLSYIIYC